MTAPKSGTRAAASTTTPNIYWSTPWAPVNDASYQAALANPQAYQAYLQEVAYLGNAIQQLSSEGWTTTTNTDSLVVMVQNDQVGAFTVSTTPTTDQLPEEARRRGVALADGDNDYYLLNWSFTGTASNVTHTTSLWLGVASGVGWTIAGIAGALVKFGPSLLGKIAQSISSDLGNAVADAADEAGTAAAEEAAEAAGVAFAEGVGIVGGIAGAVVGLTAAIIELLDKDFELRIQVVNRSSRNYLIIPDYYMDHATITAAANSVAYLSDTNQLPPSICSGGTWPYSPPVQTYNPQVGPQASEYTLAYQNSGLNAPSVLLQLIDCTYTPPGDGQTYGTLTPSAWNTGWTGVVVNTHYHTDDAPNIAMFTAGQDLGQAEDWYDQYDDVTPASTGTFQAEFTTLGWVLSANSPASDPSAGGATCWWLLITIDDTPGSTAQA
jgi:hypothetical protein